MDKFLQATKKAYDKNGITVNEHGEIIEHGWVSAIQGEQNTVPASTPAEVVARLLAKASKASKTKLAGLWFEDGLIYIDKVTTTDNQTIAETIGRAFNQKAIFNLDTMEETKL